MLLAALDMRVPPYIRTDAFMVSHRRLPVLADDDDADDDAVNVVAVELQITSPHGPRCPMPMLSCALFSFPVSLLMPEMFRTRTAALHHHTPTPVGRQ